MTVFPTSVSHEEAASAFRALLQPAGSGKACGTSISGW